jgi:phosphoglycolate phosphatase-like HAD superfamily hydrolase
VKPRLLPGTGIELVRERPDRGRVAHALLDFDGTVSLLRQGWQGVMIPLMVGLLSETPDGRDDSGLDVLVRDYVAESTGLQTVRQMIWLADQIAARGGPEREPADYKAEYLRRLEERIGGRKRALESGKSRPEEFLVPGARALLEGLRARGARLYCASGTDEPDVRREAALLGVEEFFDGGLFGARPDHREFSKKMVIERIVAEHSLGGAELLVIGDGFVEIEEGARAGGLTVGAATDEPALLEFLAGRRAEPPGADAWKRERLARAGADAIVPDFREADGLLDFLWNRR